MVAFKLPEREFKGLLNIALERTKYVYGINLPQFKKISSCLNFLKTQLRRLLPNESQYLNTSY